MPVLGKSIHIRYGTKDQYDGLDRVDGNAIYFIEDTQQIYIGDIEYNRPVFTLDHKPTEDEIGIDGRIYLFDSDLFMYISDTWVNITEVISGEGIDIDGRKISLALSGADAGTYGSNDDRDHMDSVSVPKMDVDAYGRITHIEDSDVNIAMEWVDL